MRKRENAVLIVEDHPVCAAMLSSILLDVDRNTVVDVASSKSTLLERLRAQPYSHIFLDLNILGSNGWEGLALVRRIQPYALVAIFSGVLEDSAEQQAFRLGARAFIHKTTPLAELMELVCRFLTQNTAGEDPASGVRKADAAPASSVGSEVLSLTPSEILVLGKISAGLQNKQIAFELQLSESTVKTHLRSAFRKLHVSTRTQAAMKYKDLIRRG